jgi:putative transport protein
VIDLLADQPVLLFFVVAAAGYLAGQLSFRGFSLGPAAVLFVGIGFGALDPRLKLPDELWVLGLAIFVYTVGVGSGPGFAAGLRRRGLAANALAAAALAAAGLATVGGAAALGVAGATGAGAFTGSLTSTPALAGVVEYLKNHRSAETFERLAADPVVGYSLTYPLGVVLPLLAVHLFLRRSRRRAEATGLDPAGRLRLVTSTAEVERPLGLTVGELGDALDNRVAFSRVKRGGALLVAEPDLVLEEGDLLSVVGQQTDVDRAVRLLGRRSDEALTLGRRPVDSSRFVLSSRDVAGRRVGDLDLSARFGAVVTRVRRGDADLLARPDLVLELGDQVRVVAPADRLGQLARFFGDSYRRLRELDVLTFSLGIAAGLLLGSVPLPLPGGGRFELGFAGGPLLVGLLLGALGRTGPLVWQLPHASALTLRQLGAVLFFAGIGTRSGQAFADAVVDPSALAVLALGALVAGASVVVALVLGARVLRLPDSALAGMVAAVQTQPAVLAFAAANAEDESEVAVGYATVYPLAMVVKIAGAQALLTLML